MFRSNALRHSIMPFVAALVFVLSGCTTQKDTGKVPITTSSEEAKKEFLRGRELAEAIRPRESTEAYLRAVALDSNFAMAHLNLAGGTLSAKESFAHLMKAIALAGNVSEGEKLIILAAEAGLNNDLAKQQQCYDRLIAAFPNDERVLYMVGDFHSGRREHAKAIEYLKKATELAPQFALPNNSLGYSYSGMKNYAESEKAFKKYAELVPDNPNPLDSYAELLMKTGKFDESIATYRKALEKDPHFYFSHLGIAANYLYKEKPDDAEAQLKKMYESAPDDFTRRNALFGLMTVYVDGGKWELALAEVEKQYAMGEKAGDNIQMVSSLWTRADILRWMEKYDEAFAMYKKVAEIVETGDYPEAMKENTRRGFHNSAARVLALKKKFAEAEREADAYRADMEALKDPSSIKAAHALTGVIALEQKRYDKALLELGQADQEGVSVLYRTALAYLGKNDRPKAKELLTTVVQWNPALSLDYAFIRQKAVKMLGTLQ